MFFVEMRNHLVRRVDRKTENDLDRGGYRHCWIQWRRWSRSQVPTAAAT